MLNSKIKELCDNRKIIDVKFTAKNNSKIEKYKEQFKQLTHFFRDKNLTLTDIFAIANI